MSETEVILQELVLGIHRRNGGTLSSLDLNQRLLDPALKIDSLDLAEIMAAIETRFGRSPFDDPNPPRSWGDIARFLSQPEKSSS